MIWKHFVVFSKLDAINSVGLPVSTVSSLHTLSEAINSDANLFTTSMAAITLKSDLTFVNTQRDTIIKQFLSYDTIDASTIKLKLNSTITYVDTSCQAIINISQYYDTMIHQLLN